MIIVVRSGFSSVSCLYELKPVTQFSGILSGQIFIFPLFIRKTDIIFERQLSKLACIPVTLLIQYFVYHTTVNRYVQLTLIPITIGVGYATVYDLDLNFLGTGMRLLLCRVEHFPAALCTRHDMTAPHPFPSPSGTHTNCHIYMHAMGNLWRV